MPDLVLGGCRIQPLMNYLKGLGVIRLVAAVDPTARLWWTPAGEAVLRSDLDRDGLIEFFWADYCPSPITSPWNGGSGYYPGDKGSASALTACERAPADRLSALQATIRLGRETLADLGLDGAPADKGKDKDKSKAEFLIRWRAQASDEAIEWLDATMVLQDDKPAMNPLLGTGGNDGRLEFSANFLARLTESLPELATGAHAERSRGRLVDALFHRESTVPAGSSKIGMFAPGISGLPNSLSTSRSAETGSLLNPWDLVLMLEGATAFGGGVGRQLSGSRAAFPFATSDRASNRLGRSMAGEDTRGEIWLPIWQHPSRFAAIRRFLAEGRVQDGRKQATSSEGIARAVSTLGVDRGISRFERVVFAKRSGLSFVAVSVDRVRVRASRVVDAQRDTQARVAELRRSGGDGLSDAIRTVDLATRACIDGRNGAVERWLLAIGDLERRLARLRKVVSDLEHRSPLQGVPGVLLDELDHDDPEVRLACALARVVMSDAHPASGTPAIRALIEPVFRSANGRIRWREAATPSRVSVRDPLPLLHAIAISGRRGLPGSALLSDVRLVLDGDLDLRRVVSLGFAVSLCRAIPDMEPPIEDRRGDVDRLYAASYLVARAGSAWVDGAHVPVHESVEIVPSLARGAASRAARLAVTRLTADGLSPLRAIAGVARSTTDARLIAAALAFPLRSRDALAVQRAALQSIVPTAEGTSA